MCEIRNYEMFACKLLGVVPGYAPDQNIGGLRPHKVCAYTCDSDILYVWKNVRFSIRYYLNKTMSVCHCRLSTTVSTTGCGKKSNPLSYFANFWATA